MKKSVLIISSANQHFSHYVDFRVDNIYQAPGRVDMTILTLIESSQSQVHIFKQRK